MYKLSPFPHCVKLRKWRETPRSSLCLPIEEMLVLNTLKTMLGTDYVLEMLLSSDYSSMKGRLFTCTVLQPHTQYPSGWWQNLCLYR
jgi:hypothetical protein